MNSKGPKGRAAGAGPASQAHKPSGRRAAPAAAKAADRSQARSRAAAKVRPVPLAPLVHGPGLVVKPGERMVYLSAADLARLPWEKFEILNHVQIALREAGRGKVEKPAQISLYPQRDSLLAASAAFIPNVQACGVKWFASFPNNHRLKLPQVCSMVMLADPHTGFPVAVMDAGWLIGQRGAAVSALAARLLARPGAAVATIIGAGVQGRGHIPALAEVLPCLEFVHVYDTDPAAAARAVKWAGGKVPRRVRVAQGTDLRAAVRNADVIVTATCLRDKGEPSVRAEWIRSGALLLPLDLDAVLEPAIFEQADRFYVDSLDDLKSLHERGLFIRAMPGNVTGQLGQLLAVGQSTGRAAPAEKIVCLNTGAGSVDIVLAKAVFDKACRLGVGQVLAL